MARRRSFYGLTLCMLQKLEFHRGASIPGLETNKGVRPHPRAKAALTIPGRWSVGDWADFMSALRVSRWGGPHRASMRWFG
jgi:hypothetical protein